MKRERIRWRRKWKIKLHKHNNYSNMHYMIKILRLQDLSNILSMTSSLEYRVAIPHNSIFVQYTVYIISASVSFHVHLSRLLPFYMWSQYYYLLIHDHLITAAQRDKFPGGVCNCAVWHLTPSFQFNWTCSKNTLMKWRRCEYRVNERRVM